VAWGSGLHMKSGLITIYKSVQQSKKFQISKLILKDLFMNEDFVT
jgi:hypothetical protein